MSNIFSKLAPFIQDFIYYNKWEQLRDVQIAACEAIFDTDLNLLLSSGTASGKTEAAFLPILTELHNNPSTSVGILYISPLKALINDQFIRLDQLLKDSNIPVCKWHGDASETKKNDLIKNPRGVLQITPESLESLLINKRGACLKLFSDLRYVIIDEVHYFMHSSRGIQVLCLLERLSRITNNAPRRIGLSATLGDITLAKDWLNTGQTRDCIAPITSDNRKNIRLFIERFVKTLDTTETTTNNGVRAHFEYLFKMTLDKKTIIFTNSREETEFVLSNLRELAKKYNAPDVYRVHHGNVSALLREQAEEEMKLSEEKLVIGATVTLELGIDIGSLDQVTQIGAPTTVASFAQRLGRCGRRGQIPQLLFTFVEEIQTTAADTLGPINWNFIRLIVIIELYAKEKWIEPLLPHQYPYALLYHQTLGHLKSNGELSAAKLCEDILTLQSFSSISQQDYKLLLTHLLEINHIEKTERNGLILGIAGEKIVNNFNFYSVFIVPEYYLVKDENKTIGTVDKLYPAGMRFSLAGLTWETIEINTAAKVIFVKKVPGISVVDWDVQFKGELHTVVVQKIKNILKDDTIYPYLSDSCKSRLSEIRYLVQNSSILDNLVTSLSKNRYAIFPWIGTRQLFTLHYILLGANIQSKILWDTCVYLEVYYKGSESELEGLITSTLNTDIDLYQLPYPNDIELIGKYNEFVPKNLLLKQFIEDFLDLEGLLETSKFF